MLGAFKAPPKLSQSDHHDHLPTLNLNLQFHRKFIHPPIIIILPSFSLLIELIVDHMNQLHRAIFTD